MANIHVRYSKRKKISPECLRVSERRTWIYWWVCVKGWHWHQRMARWNIQIDWKRWWGKARERKDEYRGKWLASYLTYCLSSWWRSGHSLRYPVTQLYPAVQYFTPVAKQRSGLCQPIPVHFCWEKYTSVFFGGGKSQTMYTRLYNWTFE